MGKVGRWKLAPVATVQEVKKNKPSDELGV